MLLPLVTLATLNATAPAQSATATLSGSVTDQAGAVIAQATVKAVNTATNLERKTTTNNEGFFTLLLLPPGNYTVLCERDGFATVTKRDVILNVGDQRSLLIQLGVSSVTAAVNVTADASLVNESPAVGSVVNRQFVENLPLNGRSFQSLISLTPGVIMTEAGVANTQGQFSVNGQRQNSNYFTVDGVSANASATTSLSVSVAAAGTTPALGATGGANNLVSIEALQEFKVQTSTYDAEYGRQPGAQVSLLTRSGTNEFHATLFNYLRNDALDANDFFANRDGLKRPPLRQNDFGGVIGGPLILPRFGEGGPAIYNGRNRAFFFFSYEGLRLRQPQVGNIVVPSLSSRQEAAAGLKPFLDAYPIPNGEDFGNGFARFTTSYSDPSSLNATSLRLDYTTKNKLTLFGRYNYAPSEISRRQFNLSAIGSTVLDTQTLTGGATQIFSSRVNNEVRVNYTRYLARSSFKNDAFGGAIQPNDATLFPSFASRETAALIMNITGAASLLSGNFGDNLQRQFNLVENLSVVAGSHQFKLGVDFRRLLPLYRPRNTDQFVSLNGRPALRSGIATSVSVNGREIVPLEFTNFSAYGQDKWRVTPRLTLVYGLRYEINPPPIGRNGLELFTLQGLNDPATMTLAPRGEAIYKTTYNNFAPRAGASLQLSQRHGLETVLRGGFGIFHDLIYGADSASSIPYARNKTISNIPFPLTTAQATPPPISLDPPYGTIVIADPELKAPYTYQFNVAFEQSLGTDQTVTVTYAGAVGRRLLRAASLFRPNPNFTSFVTVTNNTATSNYNALQAQFRRRLSRGLQATAAYTWSHSIDNNSADLSTQVVPIAGIDPRQDRGPSSFDVRHAFVGAVTYDMPAPRLGAVGSALLRDFAVDVIFRAQSAPPVNIFSTRDIGFGSFQFRPDLIQGVPLYLEERNAPGGRRINPAAFDARTPTAANREGTLGRNALRGFPLSQADFALRRMFNLREGLRLQLRAELFNLFNHPNFADPIGDLTSGLFGQSTQMLGRGLGGGGVGGFNPLYQIGGPRSIQLALKLTF
jgi:hypothetical protein